MASRLRCSGFRKTFLASLPIFLLLFTTSLRAANKDEVLPDEQTLAQLELRAQQAQPREQCFLYTELVHTMTEIAGKQMRDGEVERAGAMLKRTEHYAQLIHIGLANDSKRLKNAELLMHHTTFRLSEYLHQASSEDRAVLQSTLKQLNQVHEEILMHVFAH